VSLALVWIGYPSNFSFQNHFLKFNWIFNDKKKSKFKISCVIEIKISKLLSLNPIHLLIEGFPIISRVHQNFLLIFKFDLNEKNAQYSNDFSPLGWNIMKPTWCTPTHQGLSNNTKSIVRDNVCEIPMSEQNIKGA
jgi:hypothetical protein